MKQTALDIVGWHFCAGWGRVRIYADLIHPHINHCYGTAWHWFFRTSAQNCCEIILFGYRRVLWDFFFLFQCNLYGESCTLQLIEAWFQAWFRLCDGLICFKGKTLLLLSRYHRIDCSLIIFLTTKKPVFFLYVNTKHTYVNILISI